MTELPTNKALVPARRSSWLFFSGSGPASAPAFTSTHGIIQSNIESFAFVFMTILCVNKLRVDYSSNVCTALLAPLEDSNSY